MSPSASSSGKSIGCLVRLFWMGVGNLAIALCLIGIFREKSPVPDALDAIYLVAVIATLAARYVDIVRFGGTTSEGQPATLADWRRHALLLGAIAAVAWLTARLGGPYLGG